MCNSNVYRQFYEPSYNQDKINKPFHEHSHPPTHQPIAVLRNSARILLSPSSSSSSYFNTERMVRIAPSHRDILDRRGCSAFGSYYKEKFLVHSYGFRLDSIFRCVLYIKQVCVSVTFLSVLRVCFFSPLSPALRY